MVDPIFAKSELQVKGPPGKRLQFSWSKTGYLGLRNFDVFREKNGVANYCHLYLDASIDSASGKRNK